MSDIDPYKPFFMKVNDNNLDGSLDTTGEVPEAFVTLDEAVHVAREQAREMMGESFIYECLLVRRVEHGPPRVRNMDKKPR